MGWGPFTAALWMCVGLAWLMPSVARAQWLDGWSHRKAITVAASMAAADLTDFPLLVTIEGDRDVAAHAGIDGADLTFTLADGVSRLASEVERFDRSRGDLVAWVRLPALTGNAPTSLFLYFGNPSIDAGVGAATWSGDFVGVWHLGQDPVSSRCADGKLQVLCDSTSNGRHGVPTAVRSSDVGPGKVGNAYSFDGASSRLTYACENCPTFPHSISVWFVGNSGVLVSYDRGNRMSIAMTGAFLHANTNRTRLGVSLSKLPAGVWHQVVVVYRSESDVKVYADGVDATEPTDDWWVAAGFSMGARVFPNCCGPPLYLKGQLDEVRIQSVALTPEWIAASFVNQNSPKTNILVGAIEAESSGLDAGMPDGGGVATGLPRFYRIGCACGAGPGVAWAAGLLLLIAWLRRPARPSA